MNLKFTGIWIPKEVLGNTNLSLTEKLCFSLIDSLDGDDGCFASNIYIANMLHIEKRQLQNILTKLIDMGLVVREYDNVGNRKLHAVHSIALRDALHCTPPVYPIAPPQCNELHPYSKEYKKEDKTKIKGLVDSPDYPFQSEAFIKAWNSWIAYRKEIKKKLTHSTIDKQFAEMKKWGEQKAILSIELSITNGWQGLFEPARTESAKTLTKDDHKKGF